MRPSSCQYDQPESCGERLQRNAQRTVCGGLCQTDCRKPGLASVGWESSAAGLLAAATTNSDQIRSISCPNSAGVFSTLSS
ncbi:MAG: hypothetical protein ACLUHE_08945 [Christensenellales bacterium]